MAKIIGINNSVISIGTDYGGIKEVRASDLSFVPHIGDEVEIFETESKIIISKLEKKSEASVPPGGININLSNTQSNGTPPPVQAASGYGASDGVVVNKVAYVLLAFLLGMFGGHKFYSGKIGMGILYIVFSATGIPYIIAIVEAIIALTKRADSSGNIVI